MITFIFFSFGLIIGSFLNVVVYRLQTGETLLGRSHCRGCNTQIAWYDNVPVLSFVLLRGKCRQCGEKISWQYPLMELGVAVLFASVGRYIFVPFDIFSWIDTIFYLGLFSLLAVVFAYDLLTMYIPMIMIYAALAWITLYFLVLYFVPVDFALYIGGTDFSIINHVASGVGAFLFFWLLVTVSHETWMGLGDAYLALLVGLVIGWPWVLLTLTLSFGLGAGIGLLLIAFGKKGMKSQVPFAPFLVSGLMIMIFALRLFPELFNLFFLF